jgi:hypothetical protein
MKILRLEAYPRDANAFWTVISALRTVASKLQVLSRRERLSSYIHIRRHISRTGTPTSEP